MSNLLGVINAGAQGLTSILNGKTKVQFIQNNKTVITLDASISEAHSRASTPTEFPVENGMVVSDHILIKPFTLEITGIISDNPIGGIQGLLTEAATTLTSALLPTKALTAVSGAVSLMSAIAKSKSPSAAAYVNLLSLQQNGQPMDVITSLYRYSNMWISNISVPRDAASGKILLFTIQLKQLLLVSPQSVNVSIFANAALSANNADVGKQSTGPSAFQLGANAGTADANSAISSAGLAN